MTDALAAAAGGLGAVARHVIGGIMPSRAPAATVLINILGSFLLGLVAASIVRDGPSLSLILTAGFCGGFTTFSSFALQVHAVGTRARPWHATALVAAHLMPCVAAAALGLAWGG